MWQRLLTGSRAAMHFYSEFAQPPVLPSQAIPAAAAAQEPNQAASAATTTPAAAAEVDGGDGPIWMAMSAMDRARWMQETISQAVVATLGRKVGLEEALMTAGLDSLGECFFLTH